MTKPIGLELYKTLCEGFVCALPNFAEFFIFQNVSRDKLTLTDIPKKSKLPKTATYQ